MVSLLFGGDVMLGRLVAQIIRREGYDYPLKRIKHLFQAADFSIVNLECAITASSQHWSGHEKAFYFGAPPEAALSLKDAGINVVSLANNHLLDFDYQGLTDTLHYLSEQEIQFTGAAENLPQAKNAVKFASKDITFSMMAYCDHQEDFAATKTRAGINYIDLRSTEHAINQLKKDFDENIDPNTNWPILSMHWGPNMILEPSKQFIEIAHAAIDIGYKIIFGHSAHVFQGIEFYHDCPIIYATGDLVDDYAVDDFYRNDHGLLFELEMDKERIQQIIAYPIFIRDFQTVEANQLQREFIMDRFIKQCSVFGTTAQRYNDNIKVLAPK